MCIYGIRRVSSSQGSFQGFDLGKITRDHGAVIEQVSLHPRTGRPHIKLYDKVAALGHLGKFSGLSKERLEHTGPDGKPLDRRIEIEFVEPNRGDPSES